MDLKEMLFHLKLTCLQHRNTCPNYNKNYEGKCNCPLYMECDYEYGLYFPWTTLGGENG